MRVFVCDTCSCEWSPLGSNQTGRAPKWCPPCRVLAMRERYRKQTRRWREKNPDYAEMARKRSLAAEPERHWAYSLRARHGLSTEGYEAMLAAQGGVCAICKSDEQNGRRLSVDHDHSCCPGTVSCGGCARGLLCDLCNRLLVSGYERLPVEIQTWPLLNDYLAKVVTFA